MRRNFFFNFTVDKVRNICTDTTGLCIYFNVVETLVMAGNISLNMSPYRSTEKRASSLGRPPPAFPIQFPMLVPASPRAVACFPAVCTRKRRGDGRHVCAMRIGIGVSLFRGGSDVLFHPRRRQSCRTAKTYHTIVSKFANSPISLVLFHFPCKFSLSLSLLSIFLYPYLMMCPSPPTVLMYLSLFILSLVRLSQLSFSLLLFFFVFNFTSSTTHRRDFISRFYLCEKVPWYAPANFSVQFTRPTGRRRVKRALCRLRLSGRTKTILK